MGKVVRIGDWMETRSGVCFYPLDPRPDEVVFDDIAFALAHTNRFNGHVGTYSVAEHSVRVSSLLKGQNESIEMQLAGLLHDAAEIYVSDVPRPVKVCMRSAGDTAYDTAERLVTRAVEERFGITAGLCSSSTVKHADAVLLATERRDLFSSPNAWSQLPDPLPEEIRPWSPRQAHLTFSAYFVRLGGT